MLNKFLIPAALVATVIIAGIFAFMPVEKASTVHGTLSTATGLTDARDNININVDNEMDGQDRAIFVSLNMSRTADKGIHTIIPAKSGKTISGNYILSVIPNNHTSSYTSGAGHGFGASTFSCGLVDGQGNVLSVPNASKGISASGTLAPAAGRGVAVQYAGSTSNVGGVCNVMIYIDSITGEAVP